jgi:hypothetical protein
MDLEAEAAASLGAPALPTAVVRGRRGGRQGQQHERVGASVWHEARPHSALPSQGEREAESERETRRGSERERGKDREEKLEEESGRGRDSLWLQGEAARERGKGGQQKSPMPLRRRPLSRRPQRTAPPGQGGQRQGVGRRFGAGPRAAREGDANVDAQRKREREREERAGHGQRDAQGQREGGWERERGRGAAG